MSDLFENHIVCFPMSRLIKREKVGKNQNAEFVCIPLLLMRTCTLYCILCFVYPKIDF